MRNTRWISLFGHGPASRPGRRAELLRLGLSSRIPISTVDPPGIVPGCPAGSTIMPRAVTTAGPLCEVPGDGTTASSNSFRSTTVNDGQNSRMVVSTP